VRMIVARAVETGQLKDVDPGHATELLTAGAKTFFFWPKFLIGGGRMGRPSNVLCVDIFSLRCASSDASS